MKGFSGKTPAPSKKSGLLVTAAGLAWLGVVIGGTLLMTSYADVPGQAGSPPIHWPVASPASRDSTRPTLVMFVHPRCPCSKASIGELALLMAHCQGRVKADIYFLQPAGMQPDWVQTSSWQEAKQIPGIVVHEDAEGSMAHLFKAETSGDTMLYGADGRLMFHGGITVSRGHSGDNPGRSALQALIQGEPARLSKTPVFGCSLFECSSNANP